jgi:hypothetical protein
VVGQLDPFAADLERVLAMSPSSPPNGTNVSIVNVINPSSPWAG